MGYTEVLRIPADGTAFEVVRLPMVTYENINKHQFSAHTELLENIIDLVPDLRAYRETINLKYRCLFDKDWHPDATRNSWDGEYGIYKCTEPTLMRLPKNRYVKDRHAYVNAYGDAFIFSLTKPRNIDKKGRVAVSNMKEFALGVEARDTFYLMLKEMLAW